MSEIFRIYGPEATSPEDVEGYIRIESFGNYFWVQHLDTEFHTTDERRVDLPRGDIGFHEACGMDNDHSYVIMCDSDFTKKQNAQKQREYRARRKERDRKTGAEKLKELVSGMQQILIFPGAGATRPEDLYQISAAAESAGDKQLSAYIRTQGDRMKAQELSPRDAVRNVIRACHAEQEGGEREEARMVAEADVPYDENIQPRKTKKEIDR